MRPSQTIAGLAQTDAFFVHVQPSTAASHRRGRKVEQKVPITPRRFLYCRIEVRLPRNLVGHVNASSRNNSLSTKTRGNYRSSVSTLYRMWICSGIPLWPRRRCEISAAMTHARSIIHFGSATKVYFKVARYNRIELDGVLDTTTVGFEPATYFFLSSCGMAARLMQLHRVAVFKNSSTLVSRFSDPLGDKR